MFFMSNYHLINMYTIIFRRSNDPCLIHDVRVLKNSFSSLSSSSDLDLDMFQQNSACKRLVHLRVICAVIIT